MNEHLLTRRKDNQPKPPRKKRILYLTIMEEQTASKPNNKEQTNRIIGIAAVFISLLSLFAVIYHEFRKLSD